MKFSTRQVKTYLIYFLILLIFSGCSTAKEITKMALESRGVNKDLFRLGRSDESQGIVNGIDVLPHSPLRKFTVLIVSQRKSKKSVCTGVLIDKKQILTAAHCVFKLSPKDIKVIFTSSSESSKREEVDVHHIAVHDLYDGTTRSYRDIALLALKRMPLAIETKKIPLFGKNGKVTSDEVLLVGFGITNESSKDSMKLRKVTKSFKAEFYLKSKIIGIQQKGASGGFCRGDSGAPIIVTEKNVQKIIGINSFTVGMGELQDCHSASVAISVPYNLAWIKRTSLSLREELTR